MIGGEKGVNVIDCGCAIYLAPCEAHCKSLDSGEETVHVSVRFDTKYTRFAGNRHGVNLERVQRIELGIDNEPMAFDEATVAAMLQKLADERPYETEAFVLRALANALRGDDEHHRLVLKQKKPGKWESPTEFEANRNREMSWLYALGNFEKQGIKTEAAVAKIAEDFDVSRATVFAGVKRAEEFLDRAWNIGSEKPRFGPRPIHLANPRPAKREDG